MILPILSGKENKILRAKSETVSQITDEIFEFISNMQETLSSTENGIGLAAPQVGKNLQIFVIDPELAKDDKTVFINPQITRISRQTVTLQEGCLSLPERWHELARPEKVMVKAMDEKGEKFKIKAKGLLARLVCHEIDHLNGTLFIDHIK